MMTKKIKKEVTRGLDFGYRYSWCPMWVPWTRNETGDVVMASNPHLKFVMGQAWKVKVIGLGAEEE